MNGTGNGMFDPDGLTTRGMIVTMLYRMDDCPNVEGSLSFKDVSVNSFYEKAIKWALQCRIVNGYSATIFGPAAILYRYCAYKYGNVKTNGDLSKYKDAETISVYAKEAMLWAKENGIITGTSTTTLSPSGRATRAQAAAIV